MKKRSIHFSDDWLKESEDLAKILQIGGTYGELPNTLRFGTTFSKFVVEKVAEVTSGLNEDEFDKLVSSIKYLRKMKKKAESIAKIAKS